MSRDVLLDRSFAPTLFCGDALQVLSRLKSDSVDCIVTSPAYWKQRDYRIEGQMGRERTGQAYVDALAAVFSEAYRVLAPTGTAWVVLGDKMQAGRLLGLPWRFVFALEEQGWILRAEVIWNRPNAQPDSGARRRPGRAHETVFLLAKRTDHFYDDAAVLEPAKWERWGKQTTKKRNQEGMIGWVPDRPKHELTSRTTKRRRSVWSIPTANYKGAHFACVDAATECLTADGWKSHDELRVGDLAAQFDLSRQALSWAPVSAISQYEVREQEMIAARTRYFDMLLTPNHRCVIQRRASKGPNRGQLRPPAIVRADQLKISHTVPTAADWSYVGNNSISSDWAELLGWYIAEGYEAKQTLAVEMYQSLSANPEKVKRIELLLTRVGAEWTSAVANREWRGRPATSVAFRVSGYAAARLRELAPAKQIPAESLLWSDDRVDAFLTGLIGGDGCVRKESQRVSFVQKDPRQAGMVQALTLRRGFTSSLTRRPESGMCTVWLSPSKVRSFRGTAGSGLRFQRESYTGVVWCPSTPQGTWVARRAGRPFITGNSFPEKLVEPMILSGCPLGGTVLDPFCGTGVALAYACAHGRQAIGIDIDPASLSQAWERIGRTEPVAA